jgi:hypothetical protein
MTTFMLDLWHDLRAKRLWPVAVALVIGIVAIPVLLRSSSSEEPAPPAPGPTAAKQTAAGTPLVKAEDVKAGARTNLDVFDSKNPFRPVGKTQAEQAAGDPGNQSAPSTSKSTGGGSAGGQSIGGGSLGGGGGGGGGGTAPPSQAPGGGGRDTKPQAYAYTVDVRFGERGVERKHEGVRRLEMLPDEKQPLVIFLGVTSTGKTAVFMVNDSLDPEGEGRCKPSEAQCSFIYLRDDPESDDHFFTDKQTGVQYHLKLTDIQSVSTDELERQQKEDAAKGASRRLRRKEPKPFSFLLPVLADRQR